jgi:peptide/nickel transport system substrate-binding protein
MKYEKNINKILALIICVIIVTGISGCIDTNTNNGEDKTKEYVLAVAFGIDRFNGFYPWMDLINDQTANINSNIFNCLVEFDETFKIIPALAETWNNPDNLTWRFNLRKNVKFHNGYNFTAEDVKYSIELIKEDKNNTLYGFLTMVKEVRIVNDFMVDIITFEPYPILLNKLTNIYIVSKNYQENTTSELPVGTGAYRFSEYLENNHLTLERFDGDWKKTSKFQNVTFKFIDEYDERLNALVNEQVDMIDFVLPGSVDELSLIEGIKTLTFLHQVVTYLSFDFRENDSCCFKGEKNPFSDVRVRKAIYYAINIDEIMENIFSGYAKPASQFVTPYIFGYNPELERLSYNLEKARQYMKDAGYENGFEVVLDTTTVSANRVNVSNTIMNQLSKINITVILNILSSSDFYTKIMSNNSSFYIVGWRIDSGDAGEIFDNILRSVDINNGFGTSNFGNYSNPEIDKIANDIYSNMNTEERRDLMQEGFTIAMEDVACVPLYIYKGISAIINEISWQPRADGLIKLEDINLNEL